MYFRSRGVITDDQLILGLGIQPKERPSDDADFEGTAAEDLPDARGDQFLQQNLYIEGVEQYCNLFTKLNLRFQILGFKN
jgi:hypothetical protein